jgi:hypothetical protein
MDWSRRLKLGDTTKLPFNGNMMINYQTLGIATFKLNSWDFLRKTGDETSKHQ